MSVAAERSHSPTHFGSKRLFEHSESSTDYQSLFPSMEEKVCVTGSLLLSHFTLLFWNASVGSYPCAAQAMLIPPVLPGPVRCPGQLRRQH